MQRRKKGETSEKTGNATGSSSPGRGHLSAVDNIAQPERESTPEKPEPQTPVKASDLEYLLFHIFSYMLSMGAALGTVYYRSGEISTQNFELYIGIGAAALFTGVGWEGYCRLRGVQG